MSVSVFDMIKAEALAKYFEEQDRISKDIDELVAAFDKTPPKGINTIGDILRKRRDYDE